MSTPGAQGTVLVVDDSQLGPLVLTSYLMAVPCNVRQAESGESALHQVADAPPDLVLLNVVMPGLDGYAVLERLRANPYTATLPIILVTADTRPGVRLRGLEAGADELLTTPVNAAEFVARVRTMLRLKLLRDYLARRDAERARTEGRLEGIVLAAHELARVLNGDLRLSIAMRELLQGGGSPASTLASKA